MTIILAEAPGGQSRIIRAEAVVSLSAPFAWSPSLQARTVKLSNGEALFILDTTANLAAVSSALNPEGASVNPKPIPIIVAPLAPEE
jgi:hypothetical protein